MERGFPNAEFEARAARAQTAMRVEGLDAVVVTSPPNVRYVTGFASEFFDADQVIGSNFVLLATGLDDCKHMF